MTYDDAKTNAPGASTHRLWMASLVVLLVGLVLSGELVRLHFEALSDPAHHSYCSVNATVSCDTVTRSKYSMVFGVPLAVWGVFGYALMAWVAGKGLRQGSRALAALLASLSAFTVATTLVLAIISHLLIHAWCLVCLGTYAVNLVVAVLSLRLLVKQGARESFGALLDQSMKERGRTIAVLVLLGGAVLAVIVLFPSPRASAVLLAPQPKESAKALESEPSVEAIPPLPPNVHVERGVTDDGLPWMGAANPVVTITEFFDYECSHCKMAFSGLHELLELNPDRLRLVVRHFPLDKSCNRSIRGHVYDRSCSMAKLANCAKEQQRFWEAHQYLFEHNQEVIDPMTFASDLKLDSQLLQACLKRTDEALNRDIEAGIALNLHGTPAFVVDGKVYLQHLPMSVAEELRRPGQ